MKLFALPIMAVLAHIIVCGDAQAQGGSPRRGFEELPPILQKAVRNSMQLKFAGERIWELKEGPRRERIREIVWRDGKNLRIERLGSGDVIVERGEKRRTFFANQNEIFESRAQRDEVISRLIQSIRASKGAVKVESGEPIAGMKTEKVVIADPRGNVSQLLWIDEKTGLILKRELRDNVGAVVGLMEFVKLDYSPNFRPGDFEIRRNAPVFTAVDVAKRLIRKNGFEAIFLEGEGIELDTTKAVGSGGSAALVQHYQTPVGLVSLVQFKEVPTRSPGMERMGRSAFRFKVGEKEMMLIGHTGESELRRLAQRAVRK